MEYQDLTTARLTLKRFFETCSLSENHDVWYIFIDLLRKNQSYQELPGLINIELSREELALFSTTLCYLLDTAGYKQEALDLVQKGLVGTLDKEKLRKAIQIFTPEYASPSLSQGKDTPQLIQPKTTSVDPRGYVRFYKDIEGFGFIVTPTNETYYFSRKDTIVDRGLLDRLKHFKNGKDQRIPVVFEVAKGKKQTSRTGKHQQAIKIFLHRSVHELFAFAQECASEKIYNTAIEQMRKVLEIDPQYPEARELLESWRKIERSTGIPKGNSFYTLAKQATSPEEALQFYDQAIERRERLDSAVKDKAQLLAKLDRGEEATALLLKYRPQMKDRRAVDNLLINIYQKRGAYDQALELLLTKSRTEGKQSFDILSQISTCYMRKKDYPKAEHYLREMLELNIDQIPIQKRLAFCLYQQGRYDDAEQILLDILRIASDDIKAKDLLESTKKAKQTGISAEIQDAYFDSLSDISNISKFARFYLDRRSFAGVPPTNVQENQFDNALLNKLEREAADMAERNPGESAARYLSAATIISIQGDQDETGRLRKDLYRFFSLSGEAARFASKPHDVVRTWYSEALRIYSEAGKDSDGSKGDRDALRLLIRYLHLNMEHTGPQEHTLEKVLAGLLLNEPEDRIFEDMLYLTLNNSFATGQLLPMLYQHEDLRQAVLPYLQKQLEKSVETINSSEEFEKLWSDLLKKYRNTEESIFTTVDLVGKIEFTQTEVQATISRLREISQQPVLRLDQHRINKLVRTLNRAFYYCNANDFGELNLLGREVEKLCQDLLEEIEQEPTRFSIEHIYNVVKTLQDKIRASLEQVSANFEPQIELSLPMDEYHDTGNKIDVQIAIKNGQRCSPAEKVELSVQEDRTLFSVLTSPSLDRLLSGGEEEIVHIPIQVKKKALSAQAFSLAVSARYHTHTGIQKECAKEFSIRLYPREEFKEITNPYKPGPIIKQEQMFFGRSKLIERVAKYLCDTSEETRSFIIYGQKRAGKSSILYHLINQKLADNRDLLILELDCGRLLDENIDFRYQFCWDILSRLKERIQKEITKNGRSQLDLQFIDKPDFYADPSPILRFQEFFRDFKRITTSEPDWHNTRVLLAIDEFQYIYDQIVRGKVSRDFMRNWKSLLNESFFSAVLVGQDVMTKFHRDFSNEFGTTEKERVSYLNSEDAKRLIEEPISLDRSEKISRYRGRAIERILDLSANSPFYIQHICKRLVDYMNQECKIYVTEADVDEIREEMIYGVNSLEEGEFDNLIDSGDTSSDAIPRKDILNVLKTIARYSSTGSCNAHLVTDQTQISIQDVEKILNDLNDREVIKKRQGSYSLRVGLFKEWLLANE